MINKLVKIKWLDSQVFPGWREKSEVMENTNLEIHSVGYVFKETDEELLLVAHISAENFNSAMYIPKCAIKEIIEINQNEENEKCQK